MSKRNRKVWSIKKELLNKSREAALAAVQIFNNPNITFKSESYIVLMVIAWTYLLHAYYREKQIDYRYYSQQGKRKEFDKTKHGAKKHWELERCLHDSNCPIDKDTQNNLKFLIGLRHEIEHQMTTRIDDILSARFQACCLNYNREIKRFFGDELGIEKHLSFSLQFSSITTEQKDLLSEEKDLPSNIQAYIQGFDNTLSEEEFSNPSFAYRILFVPKTANRKGQADKVIEFVKSDSELAEKVNKEYTVLKETERKKYLPSQVISQINQEGFPNFKMYQHTELWKKKKAKDSKCQYGVVVGKTWYWYESWLNTVREHCKSQGTKFK